MNSAYNQTKRLTMVFALLCSFTFINAHAVDDKPEKPKSIQLALLLDTSNSMDGLIDQAKSQLWKIVNELAKAECDDSTRPVIRIALYEYGNDGLPSTEGYIRQVSALTGDLDVISEKLFALTTNGGNEFCGQVINTSLKQLDWSASAADLKMIFIAGNEPFTQGEIPYRLACSLAKEKNVVVNSIYCGAFSEGLNTSWKNGADITGGTYMSIEQDRKTVYIASPYDDKIAAMNEKLNDTYVFYGSKGASKKEQQAVQDSNAERYGSANKVERTVSKSSAVYENSTWDLVDASKNDYKAVEEAEAKDLPEEMRRMSVAQRKDYVKVKAADRARIQKEIQSLSEKRSGYIAEHSKPEDASTLDAAMMRAIREQAKVKNLNWK